uniref:NAC domain-containing protein n=1 Tax=Fagus sylvatica TaxID=28930 RepID=A0A2N9GSY9_FAGSY
MYRDRVSGGGGSSRSEIVGVPLDRKRIINDALDKHLEKSSPSTSRVGGLNSSSKDKERLSVPSTSTCVSAEAMGLLPGYRFLPTELELIRCYLLNKVTGNPIPGLDNHVMNPVIECDLYGDPTIWMNIFEETGMKCLYFYTKLKIKKKMGKKSDENNGNRVERSTEWGTWRGQSDGKVCQNRIHVGSKRSFTYGAKKGFNANNSGWVIHSYNGDTVLPHSTTDQQMFEQYSNINGLLAPHSTKDAEDDYYLTEEELEELMSSPDLDTGHDAFTSLTQLLA